MAAAGFLRDHGVRWVLGGWSFFTLENLIMSEYRKEIKLAWGGRGGPKAYHNFYNALSSFAVGSTVLAYIRYRNKSLALSPPSAPRQAAAFACRAAGLIAIGQLMPPINTGVIMGAMDYVVGGSAWSSVEGAMCPLVAKSYKEREEIFGIGRVTRRPELFGLMFAGIGGALMATTAAQVAFFGIGPFFSFGALAFHSDRTQRKNGELSATKEAQTSVVPFQALLDGRQSWSKLQEELVLTNALLAVSLSGLMSLRPVFLTMFH